MLKAVETARNKCLRAMELTGCDIGVASEGSFGPDPVTFCASADDEILIFIDKANELEIIVRKVSLETNFGGRQVTSESELLEFADSAQFPSHGLILRGTRDDNQQVFKGISSKNDLIDTFRKLSEVAGSAYVETDMRAMHNPTRMKVIGDAATKLAAKIMSRCPECDTPGFGIADRRNGLKCNICGSQTRSTLSLVHRCIRCGFEKDEM